MKTTVFNYKNNQLESHVASQPVVDDNVQLIMCFASKEILKAGEIYPMLRSRFSNAAITMCSTAGEIYHDTVHDNSAVVVAMELEKTSVLTASVNIQDYENSYDAAIALAGLLPPDDLAYMMVFSDGSLVNGSELVKGLSEVAGKKVLVTGGLAGDGANFESTLVGLNEQPSSGKVVAIGFYGNHLVVKHGSQGGWDTFGLEKEITKSKDNVLFEINGKNALELYKNYLGSYAQNLPGAALLFPLEVTIPGSKTVIVRTILSIDEEKKSMTFAGDVPTGSKVRLMKANFDRLTAAAATAASHTVSKMTAMPDFALLVSCVGRKIILGTRTEEEVEAVSESFNYKTLLAGFYSYGEISPFNEDFSCQLHNQTMTITSFYELS
ncbi:MAG: FIST N-terminal domain-containing protein [Ferruginibacter sp.]